MSAVAAKQAGRDFVGIDRSESYVDTARRRLEGVSDDTEAEIVNSPSASDDIAQYIVDGFERQEPTTLRKIEDYANELASHREFVPTDELEEWGNDSEQIAGVTCAHNGTVVLKEVPCGKENCLSCPHGPYKYRIYRDGDTVKTKYLGSAESVSKS